ATRPGAGPAAGPGIGAPGVGVAGIGLYLPRRGAGASRGRGPSHHGPGGSAVGQQRVHRQGPRRVPGAVAVELGRALFRVRTQRVVAAPAVLVGTVLGGGAGPSAGIDAALVPSGAVAAPGL